MKVVLPCIWIILLISSYTAIAQPVKPAATLKGVVLDVYDARIPNANIVITGPAQAWRLQTNSGGKEVGTFTVSLPAGTYAVKVSGPGFKTLDVKKCRLRAGGSKTIVFHLVVRPCDDCEGIIEMPKKLKGLKR